MGHTFHALASACLLATASCSGGAEQAATDRNALDPKRATAPAEPSSAKSDQARLLLEGGGLVLKDRAGSSRQIAFGSPASAAVGAASQIYGRPLTVETLGECGAGPLHVSRFAGLTIAAQDGKFAGWSLDDRGQPPRPATATGIGIGSSRRELESAHSVEAFDSSLGQEFTANGLAGLLDAKGDSAKITHLWAGATCIMR